MLVDRRPIYPNSQGLVLLVYAEITIVTLFAGIPMVAVRESKTMLGDPFRQFAENPSANSDVKLLFEARSKDFQNLLFEARSRDFQNLLRNEFGAPETRIENVWQIYTVKPMLGQHLDTAFGHKICLGSTQRWQCCQCSTFQDFFAAWAAA